MPGGKSKENLKIIGWSTRYGALATQLKETGLVLQGTITERTIEPSDRRGKIYGPYYQWTRKIRAKTVTINLSPSQAKIYQTAIDNNKRMEKVIEDMRNLSLKICAATTVGVKKRKF
jgi:hypothetical protein